MNYERTYEGIIKTIEKNDRDMRAYEDGLTLMREWIEKDREEVIKRIGRIRKITSEGMVKRGKEKRWEEAEKLRRIIYEEYKLEAPYRFDAYCLALEYDRPVEEQFYYPRRRVLKKFADELQRLEDGEIKELFLSCPPRIGKTTLLLFFMTWVIGRNPEKSNLYSSFSDTITNSFYNGLLEIMEDGRTYHWGDIFTGRKISKPDAKNETIDVDRKRHYPSITCRSLYGTLNGACDCSGIMVADDLLSGIEEAVSKDRLDGAWLRVDNNLLPRAKQSAKILWCGTRWSIGDPIGRRKDLIEESDKFKNWKYKVFNIPALDKNDESNFDYMYGVGFSTEMYQQRRASFEKNNDMASWFAQYMGEPIEREGTVFTVDGFRYYNGELPKEEPDRVFMAVDPAFGGGDSVASPVCVQYGMDVYVPSVVFSDEEKNVTQPKLADKAVKYNVRTMQIEATKTTQSYAEGVSEELKKREAMCTVITKPAGTSVSKEQRIYDAAPDIREHFIFLESNKRDKEYRLYMQEVFAFKITGKNKHDDAPDSLGMARDMLYMPTRQRKKIFDRPF